MAQVLFVPFFDLLSVAVFGVNGALAAWRQPLDLLGVRAPPPAHRA